jgi:hypothetical protein
MALVAYVAAVLYAPGDDLGRTGDVPADASVDHAWAEPSELPDERLLVDVPPPGRPST